MAELDFGLFRAVEDAVDALARLDQAVAGAPPSTATLLLLRSAQAIVAAGDRPPDTEQAAHDASAAVLGWWYAPAAREFIPDATAVRGVALVLRAAAEKIHGGRALTVGMLDEAMADGGLAADPLPYAFEWMLRRAELEEWPPLRLAAELSAGSLGAVQGVRASAARAAAMLASRVVSGIVVLPPSAADAQGALHALAAQARTVRRVVAGYVGECARAADECRTFGRGKETALAIIGMLTSTPAITVAHAASALGVSVPTVGAGVERLEAAGLLREITGRARDRVFVYTPAVTVAD